MNFTNSLVSLTLLSASFAQANLIAYWPFDDLSGEVAEDIIGGYNGKLNGGTWLEPGKVGAGALEGESLQGLLAVQTLTMKWDSAEIPVKPASLRRASMSSEMKSR